MTEAQLRQAQRALRSGDEPPRELLTELDSVARALVFRGNLPASLSPHGVWSDEAIEDVVQGWLEARGIRGGLVAIVDRSATAGAFRRLTERSLRHWLLNERRRTHTQNLYARMAQILSDDAQFSIRREGNRPQDVWWTSRNRRDTPLFEGGDRELASAAWALGDFELLRHSEGTRLSPLLSGEDLTRFVAGMLDATGRALTLGYLTRALQLRFDLREPDFSELAPEDERLASPERVAEEAVLRDVARTVLAELTSRQADVLLGSRADETLEAMARRHGSSPATIYNEQRRIAAIVARYSENDSERDRLLKIVGDLLYESST